MYYLVEGDVFVATLSVFLIILGTIAIYNFLRDSTYTFEKIAGFYHKQKIKKDIYHYVRKFNPCEISSYEELVNKTLAGVCGFKFRYIYNIMRDLNLSPSEVQKSLKVFQYALYRLESSQNYKNLVSCYKQDKEDLIDESSEGAICSLLKEVLLFIKEVQTAKHLNFVNTTLYFDGKNLSNLVKKNIDNINFTLNNVILEFNLYEN